MLSRGDVPLTYLQFSSSQIIFRPTSGPLRVPRGCFLVMGRHDFVSASFRAHNLTQEEHWPAVPCVTSCDACFFTAALQCKQCTQRLPRSRPRLSPGLRGFSQRFASWMGRESEPLCEQTADTRKNMLFQQMRGKADVSCEITLFLRVYILDSY